jgi:hypothetical protein
VRNLQALLAEKEEELRDVKIEKSKFEYDAEGFQQRVKTLDESESRYKDENWSLETQVHELLQAQKEAADREKKLQQVVNILQVEKNSAQRELDEVKLSHSKLSEEHAATIKHHDTELGAAKRNMVMADADRASMQRKIDDLTGQNQELAKAVSSQRGRTSDKQEILLSDEDFETANDNNTPEHSPPPSPIKGTPRHSLLESETLKTSLHHAQRTIQSLRTNVHREKTEKLELRRMLQDARDELEKVRNDPMAGTKRSNKTSSREFKKPPRLLGGLRSARSEIFSEDPNWEDHQDTGSPSHPSLHSRPSSNFETVIESTEKDDYEAANDTSDQAFETANERGTETDDFHTGAEEFSSEEDVQTETDSPTKRRTYKNRPPNLSLGLNRSGSVHSTASTEDEYSFEDTRTPTSQLPPLQHKFPLRVSRGASRRSRHLSEDPTFQSSPASFAESAAGTPQPVQSLAAELGDFDGSDNESNVSATPSRRSIHLSRPGSIRGTTASPPPPVPQLPKVIMVDSGMMTEPVPEPSPISPVTVLGHERPMSLNTVASGFSASEYSESGAHDMAENLAKFPSPPTSPPTRDLSFSDMNADAVGAVVDPEVHAAELESLRQDYTKQIEQLHTENAAAHATTLAALHTNHADELSRAVDEARAAHARELDALKSGHAEQTSKASTEAAAAHARELEALQTSHLEKIAQMDSEHKAAHASELEMLKTSHAEQLATSKKDHDAAHAAELAILVAAHAAQIEHAKKQLTDSHAKDLESLKASHIAQIDQAKQGSDTAHADELESLKASHLAQIDQAKNSIAATHAQELDALKAAHGTQVDQLKKDSEATHAAELAALAALHSKQLESSKAEADATLAKELESVKSLHAQQLESSRADAEATLSRELEALKSSHANSLEASKAEGAATLAQELATLQTAHAMHLESSKAEGNAALAREIESIKAAHSQELGESKRESDKVHAAELATLAALHAEQLASSKSEGESRLSKELAGLRDTHSQEIDNLRTEHATAHAKELEGFKAAFDKQIESSKSEGNVSHSQQIEAINAANAEILEAHKRDSENTLAQTLESAKASHERQIETLRSESAAARSKELDELVAKHGSELEALKAETTTAKAKAVEDLVSQHERRIEVLQAESTAAKAKELEEMSSTYNKQIEVLKGEAAATKSRELEELATNHQSEIDALRAEASASSLKQHEQLTASHSDQLYSLKAEHESGIAKLMEELAATHALKIESLRSENEASKAKELEALSTTRDRDLDTLRKEHEASRAKELEDLQSNHVAVLSSLRTEHQTALDDALQNLKATHAKDIDSLHNNHAVSKEEALATLKSNHVGELDYLKAEHEEALARELDAVKAQHARVLEAQHAESSADREKLLASHAAELEALRKSLTVTRPTLGFSSLSTIETEPIEAEELLRSPKRDAFIIPREAELPQTPSSSAIGGFGRKGKGVAVPIIAEDETRQSPSTATGPETPESQRPFKEISTNTDARPSRKQAFPPIDQSSQTTLTSDGIDRLLLKQRRRPSQDVIITPFDEAATPSTVRHRRSQGSLGSPSRSKGQLGDSGILSGPEPVPVRRPGSATSAHGPLQMPPLPANHREVIEAARTGSSNGGKGSMGPPLLPASAYKNAAVRPRTPRDLPQSPTLGRDTPTPRAIRSGSTQGYGEVHSPTKMTGRSRQSSVSSFTSEIENRFNIRGDMSMEAAGLAGPGTDPRMIQAITQTMIGEYLWKYTRKTGRGEMSENRHRRYFWVHPYTRTLYWSDRDPSTAGRAELKAKSVPIEAVRVVTDDNPMPPGLHRKSLVIISPGRTVKFTCTTGQRHETWFNALSYLLLRTGTDGQNDADEMAGNITQEDVDEFNPSFGRRPAMPRRAPPSLSSYNSRTTRNESPNVDMMSIPTLTPTHEKGPTRPGTLNRLSGYWKSGTSTSGSIFGSFRGRSNTGHTHTGSAIYEASEVNDSAEDLRQIIERQDRESDRLENVRACCDGE